MKPFDYAAYAASLPPELRAYVPPWGPINGVPIEDVVKMLLERDARIRELEAAAMEDAYALSDAMSRGDTL